MTDDHLATTAASFGWDFPGLTLVWDWESRAIVTGADKLEALSEGDRTRSLTALSGRVRALAEGLDDGWLVATAFIMVEDLYKSYFHQFRWTPGIKDYIAATAGVFMQVLAERGFVLHYVIDNTQSEDSIGQALTYVPAIFQVAGFLVTGPQLMALELMQKADHRPRDVAAIPRYRTEGHHVANRLIARCHQERRSSVYLNLDLDDDAPGLSLRVALSQGGAPGTIVVFRDASPQVGTVARLAPPPGIRLPGARRE
ncbi:hypothetical protein [Mycolicibacterium elephantis]|uniref:hypothetical protein n=1 Tax=Mycolicibacterium elephantis TaxID=81858 RepID=UPI001A995A43|nr:hypothetical protein [Mycolicibacterium elephantis]